MQSVFVFSVCVCCGRPDYIPSAASNPVISIGFQQRAAGPSSSSFPLRRSDSLMSEASGNNSLTQTKHTAATLWPVWRDPCDKTNITGCSYGRWSSAAVNTSDSKMALLYQRGMLHEEMESYLFLFYFLSKLQMFDFLLVILYKHQLCWSSPEVCDYRAKVL